MNTSSTIEAAIASAAILMAMSSNSVADPIRKSGVLHRIQVDHPAYAARGRLVPVPSTSLDEAEEGYREIVTITPASSRPSTTNYLTRYNYLVDPTTTVLQRPVSQRPALPELSAPEQMIAWASQLWSCLPDGTRFPAIWSDEGEIAFEWKWGDHHAILSIEEDGTVGYAMLVGERFLPGREIGSRIAFPTDLLEYLKEA